MRRFSAAVSSTSAVIVAAVAWLALMLQYWLILWDGPAGAMTIRYLSFFTILSNILVALVTTSVATGGNWAPLRFLRRPTVRGLAALSISVTCLVYATILAGQWHPQGPQLIADRGLHYVIPALYLVWWAALVPHGSLAWSDSIRWLIFPLAFLVWSLLRGAAIHEYPYPFLDVTRLGYAAVLGHAAMVGALFLVLGLLLVALDRFLARYSTD